MSSIEKFNVKIIKKIVNTNLQQLKNIQTYKKKC